MNHNKLATQLKAVIIGVAILGLMVYLWIVPSMGISVAASALSHLIMEAADLQEQSDFTI